MVTEDRSQHMAAVADALAKGLAIFTAVLGVLAARDGGVGRLVANAPFWVYLAVACAVLSIVLAFAARLTLAVGRPRGLALWLLMIGASLALFTVGVVGLVRASVVVGDLLERPTLSVEHEDDRITFTATIDLLRAKDFMRTTVYGYPDRRPRELLFNSTTGPSADGQATVTGSTTVDLSRYTVVEVRAFRGSEDPGCERPRGDVLPAGTAPTACASIWLEPRVEARDAG